MGAGLTVVSAAGRRKYVGGGGGLAAVDVVRRFREEVGMVRSTGLAAAFRRLGPLSPEQAEQIEHCSKALMNKFLHEPSVRLKAAAANGRGLGVVVVGKLDRRGRRAHHVEGLTGGRWVLLDFVDFVVHLFHPDTRSFYQLERLWSDAPELLIGSS